MIYRAFIALLPSLSLGDMCQDFCVQTKGESGCSRGSYCNNGYDCHSMFWTSLFKTGICIPGGRDSSCTTHHPVLCTEASAATSSSSAVFNSHFDFDPNHVLPGEYRPFLSLKYLNRSSTDTFVALLDTKSEHSIIPLFVVRGTSSAEAALYTQQYGDFNFMSNQYFYLESRTLSLDGTNSTDVYQVIPERMQLHASISRGTYTFESDAVLILYPPPHGFVIGAARNSAFARSVDIFAYTRDGLVIGQEAVDVCEAVSPAQWVPLVNPNIWSFMGELIFGSVEGRSIEFVIDTGAPRGFGVTEAIMNSVRARLVAQGAVVEGIPPTYFTNCDNVNLISFPSIEYIFEAHIFEIRPSDYIKFTGGGRCRMDLFTVEQSDDNTVVHLGPATLSSFDVVFDNSANRVAFCNTTPN